MRVPLATLEGTYVGESFTSDSVANGPGQPVTDVE